MSSAIDEAMMPIAAAARTLPRMRSGAPVHVSTVMRWILDGVRDRKGGRIKLEAWRLGQRWVTSKEAIARFVAATTGQVGGPARPDATNRPDRLEAELTARGL